MQYRIVPVTSFNQNCSIIWCEITHEATLVDPGGESNKIRTEVNKLDVKIGKILLTHGHIDHVGSAVELKKYYGVPIIGPNQADQILLNSLTIQCNMLGLDVPPNNTAAIVPDFWLQDGDIVQVGHEVFNVLHCPGHSPGHVVYWNKIQKFIIMGDVLFKENIGRTDLPGGNITSLINSIKNKLFLLGDDIVFLPGHGAQSTIGHERVNNTFVV